MARKKVFATMYLTPELAVVCASCGTRFRVLRWQESRPWLDKHLAACATKTEEERQFYRENRRWPPAGGDVAAQPKRARGAKR